MTRFCLEFCLAVFKRSSIGMNPFVSIALTQSHENVFLMLKCVISIIVVSDEPNFNFTQLWGGRGVLPLLKHFQQLM